MILDKPLDKIGNWWRKLMLDPLYEKILFKMNFNMYDPLYDAL
jgi:hypothetical protein